MSDWKGSCAVLLLTGLAILAAAPPDSAEPRFTAQNELLRPEGYREWIFLSSSLGMSYDEGSGGGRQPKFNNIFVHPVAFRAFRETGRFPENTILVLESMTAATGASINQQGHTQGEFRGLEAAVKNSARFPEGWAYFSFSGSGGLKDRAAAFPKEDCWSCHKEHAQIDNVFTQFYPTLRKP